MPFAPIIFTLFTQRPKAPFGEYLYIVAESGFRDGTYTTDLRIKNQFHASLGLSGSPRGPGSEPPVESKREPNSPSRSPHLCQDRVCGAP